jgi:glutathione S-transferase
MLRLTSFKWVPPFAQGLVRDLRVRWALEEAGLPYTSRLIDSKDQTSPAYRSHQPFGQVPVLEDGDLVLFESGAIVLHIGSRSDVLLPAASDPRARAATWVFAALNTLEPAIQQLGEIDLFAAREEWAKLRRPQIEKRVQTRLSELAAWIGDRDFLEDRFTAGDLMMTTVLQILRHTNLIAEEPVLKTYVTRCESRPAFQRAFAAQMASFEKR